MRPRSFRAKQNAAKLVESATDAAQILPIQSTRRQITGLLRPFPADKQLQQQRLSQLDRLYQKVTNALDLLLHAVGLKAA